MTTTPIEAENSWMFVNALQILGVLPVPFPFPLPSLPSLLSPSPPFNPARQSGERGALRSRSSAGPHFGAFWGKSKAFQVTDILYCLTDIRLSDGTFTAISVSAASYRTTEDLFYDGTNHTINYVDEIVCCTRDCVGVIVGPTHWRTHAG